MKNNLEDKNETYSEEIIAKWLLPPFIETLMLMNKLDKNRLDDVEYVWQTAIQNIDILDDAHIFTRFDQELLAVAKDAAKQEKIPVTIILVATAIEHILNIFYRDALVRNFDVSEKDISEILRNNMNAKLGWMSKVIFNNTLSTNLKKRIEQIIELRNGFIHYKPAYSSENGKDNFQVMIEKAKKIGIEDILNTPSGLENEIVQMLENIFPELKTSKKVAKLMSKNRKEKSE